MFNFITKLRFKFNFYIRYKSDFMGNVRGVKQTERKIPIIISITSKEENFYDLELTLYSILNQSVLPDRIILWLSDKYDLVSLPYGITRYIKNGLEIRFVKDLNDFNKIIYPLKEFSKSIIVTASDCIYYQKNWLKKLYHSYISNPEDIHAHAAFRVNYNEKISELTVLKKNIDYVNEESARFDNLAIDFGGILYPPSCFRKEVFREDIYSRLSNTSDVWMWIMSLLSNRKTRVVKSHTKTLTCINFFKYLKESFQKYKNYDTEINNLMPFYGHNIKQKLNNQTQS